MDKQKAKTNARIRYDNAFKQAAISMITEQHLSIELNTSTDSLRTWIRDFGFDPNRDNSQAKRIRELKLKRNITKTLMIFKKIDWNKLQSLKGKYAFIKEYIDFQYPLH